MTKSTINRNNNLQRKKDKKGTKERAVNSKPLCGEHQLEHCSYCFFGDVREWEKEFIYEVRKIEEIGKSPEKSAVEKKMEIFDVLLEMNFGKLSASENERANILLKSHFYGELAKKYLKEYKEATTKEFSNN
jgi:hypothetical protein